MSKMFLNEFEAFAIDADISEYSAAQYKSYLRNVCKKTVVFLTFFLSCDIINFGIAKK